MKKYRKAIVAVVGAVVAVLAVFGLDVPADTATSTISVLTALAVYIVPNE